MMRTRLVATLVFCGLLSNPAAAAYTAAQIQKLLASDAATGASFGRSNAVSIDGNTAVIGAVGAGTAYVFTFSNGAWTEQAILTPSDAGGNFGETVAVSGNTAMVGAVSNLSDQGAIYVFDLAGVSGTVTEDVIIRSSDGAAGDRFGYVALDGDLAVIGAPLDDDNGADSGSVYLFERIAGTWTEQAKLLASDGLGNDQMGYDVALSGGLALVGISRDADKGLFSGSARVFNVAGATGTVNEFAKLLASDGEQFDRLGNTVALSGTTALVAATGDDDGGAGAGAVYVYDVDGVSGTVSEDDKLLASDASTSDFFGGAIVIWNDLAIIGAETADGTVGSAGAAYLFERAFGTWSERLKFFADDGAAFDLFGTSIGLSSAGALAGASNDDSGTGAVYAFSVEEIIAAGDHNGDGRSDVLFRNNASGANQLYVMDGLTIIENAPVSAVSPDWQAIGRGDFDDDGNADILWRFTPTGAIWIFLMDGSAVLDSVFVVTVGDSDWEVVGNGDYNGDDRADILWHHQTLGTVWLYEMDGNTILNSVGIGVVPDTNWQIAGSGDYNGDGRSDILWRNLATGTNWMYLMDSATITTSVGISVVPDLNWEIAGNGDHDGDLKSDILWRNVVSGTNWVYLMDGTSITTSGSISVLPDPNWNIVGAGDYDGDAKADVLWRNFSTGTNFMYLMDGVTITDSGNVSVVSDQDWQVVNTN